MVANCLNLALNTIKAMDRLLGNVDYYNFFMLDVATTTSAKQAQ